LLTGKELVEAVIAARDRGEDLALSDAAFNRIVTAFQDFAVGTAYAYLGEYGAAEDAAQESFLAAWRALPSLREPALFPAWFKRILANQCSRQRRSMQRVVSGVAPDPAAPGTFEDLLGNREAERLVGEALAALPPAQRLVVSLFYLAGENHASIAKFLAVPRSTIVKRLHAAKRKLKPLLAPLRIEIGRRKPSRASRFAALVRSGIYDDYVGVYRFVRRPELTVTIRKVGNRLVSFASGQKNTVMLGARITELRVAEFDGKAQFFRDARGNITHLVYYEFGKRMGAARKITSAAGS
jgi:RNA polymerase sigma factor (sigma-70 family)